MKGLKGIKSLALIFTFALILTVGAVYAVFVYSQASPEAVSNNMQTNIIADAQVDGKKGTITLGNNTLTLKVKNKGNNTTAYDEITGSLTATFTPDTNADEDVTNNGIAWQFKIEFVGTNQYGGSEVLSTTAATPVKLNDGTKSKTVTLNNAVLSQHIQVAENVLKTKAEYDSYKAVYEAITIKITLSEYVGG